MNDSSNLSDNGASIEPTFFSTGIVVAAEEASTAELNSPLSASSAPGSSGHENGSEQVQATLRPQLPPKPITARYDTLDVVRGMACLMLMFYHATFYAERSWATGDPSTWTLGGLGINLIGRLWMGVPMFFVVSGYCIAASIDSLRRKPHSLVNYFYRRLRRIYPPLWGGFVFAILFTLIIGLSSTLSENCLQLPRLATFSLTDWFANFSATTSWFPKVVGGESNHLLLNTWTLCYEEQFYAVAGILLVLASRRFFLASYAIAAATLITRHVCRWYGVPISGFFFDGHWLLFVCGILLYQRVNYLTGKPARAAIIAMAVGAVYGLGERMFAVDPHDRHVGEYILVACTFGIFLSYIKRWDKQIAKHWSLAPFRWSGKISYSLYLTHFPITVFIASFLALGGVTSDADVLRITVPACLILSFPVAYVFYLLVERRYVNAGT